MNLEDKLRRYAEKGELVHLSIAFNAGKFYANFAAASPASGYAHASDEDPVSALEKVFAAAPVKVRASNHKPVNEAPVNEPATEAEDAPVTAAVNPAELPTDWTKP